MRRILDKLLTNTLIILMSIMVLSTLLQVFARVIELNVPFTEELTVYAMMWVTLFGSTYAFGLRKHIVIDILSETLKPENKWKHTILIEIIIIIFAVLILIIGGVRFAYVTFKLGQVSSVMQIPKGWIYLALPFSGLLIIFYNILNIIDTIKSKNQS